MVSWAEIGFALASVLGLATVAFGVLSAFAADMTSSPQSSDGAPPGCVALILGAAMLAWGLGGLLG